MKPKIYLFRAYQINFTNLTPALAFNIAGVNSYVPTEWRLHKKFIYLPKEDQACDKITDMVSLDGSELNGIRMKLRNEFRYIKWSANTKLLGELINNADSDGKFQILSTSIDEEINFLKEYLGDDVITIGTYYTNEHKDMLYKDMADNHVFSLRNNLYDIQDQDKRILELDDASASDYYFTEFKKLELLPKTTALTSYDITLSVTDYLNKDLITDVYSTIGLPFDQPAVEFYDSWVTNQQ